jgi:hypothetical protein
MENNRSKINPSEKLGDLSIDEVRSLPAGAAHYRAYVGPADRYDFMSATQFSMGCGSIIECSTLAAGHYALADC